jgi:bifunctional non-homologous end joining protein LigD
MTKNPPTVSGPNVKNSRGRRKTAPAAVAPSGDQDQAVVGGVTISHPDKLWWPQDGITKLDVVHFYDGIAPRLLPWLAERPLVAERCPGGMQGACFFQKNFARGLPDGVPTVALAAQSAGRTVEYVVGGSKQTLLALVNLGCIAIHVMNCRAQTIARPDWLAFDLDPSSGAFADAARAGRLLHGLLDELGVRSFAKTSGSRGLHVLVPLADGLEQQAVRDFARAVAGALVARAPDQVTLEMAKRARGDRVFIDVLRNAFGQTIVPPYAVRRRPQAPVSTPLDWDEVEPRLDPARYNLATLERRLGKSDPWADFWQQRQQLPDLSSWQATAPPAGTAATVSRARPRAHAGPRSRPGPAPAGARRTVGPPRA